MLKKLLTVVLALIMCLSLVACGGGAEEKAWEEFLVGEWIAENGNRDKFPEGLSFNEDGTCIINGEEYEWEVRNTYENDADYFVKDGKNNKYRINASKYDSSYSYINLNEVDAEGNSIGSFGTFYKVEEFTKIEITEDNWQEYFETVKKPMSTVEDAFGEVVNVNFYEYLLLGEEYGEVCEYISNGAIEYSYVHINKKATVDLEAGTYVTGEETYRNTDRTKQTSSMTGQYQDGENIGYGVAIGGLYFDEFPEDTVSLRDDMKVERIKGTIYCIKGE